MILSDTFGYFRILKLYFPYLDDTFGYFDILKLYFPYLILDTSYFILYTLSNLTNLSAKLLINKFPKLVDQGKLVDQSKLVDQGKLADQQAPDSQQPCYSPKIK